MLELMDFNDIKGLCREQGVRLHKDIVDSAEECRPGVKSGVAYRPSDMHYALTEAGSLLRTDPAVELADKPLEVDAEKISLTSRTLINMVNDSLAPFEPDDNTTVLRTEADSKRIDACREAEDRFIKAFICLKNADSDSVLRHGCDVIVDQEGKAVFISKSEKVQSSLSLQDIVLNGVRIPAGSIMRVRLQQEGVPIKPNPKRIGYYSLSDVETASFARLSAFAFPASVRRSEFPKVMEGMSKQRRQLFNRTSLGELAVQVNTAVERIGLAAA